MRKLLLGLGVSNESIKKYFDNNKIEYDIYNQKSKYDLSNYEMIVKSNGFKMDFPLLIEAKNKHVCITNDLELFIKIKKNIKNSILVTGSNGKTTVVSILEKCIDNGKAIGNNGLPFFDYIDKNYNYIFEVSSFMLETAHNVHFKYNIITNIFVTHLEHHNTFVNYVKSKCSFMKKLNKNDYLIYNYDDQLLRRIVSIYNCKKISFSQNNKKATLFIDKGFIYYLNKRITSIEHFKLIGNHNLYNIMASIGLLINYKNTKANYRDIINNFMTIKHRIELIYDGTVKIYNDSKSTNFNSLRVSLDCFKEKRVLLIVGGKKRKDDFKLLDNKIKCVVEVFAFGENKMDFKKYFETKDINCKTFSSLEALVNKLVDINYVDVILFSPASTSFDLYNNFEERGEHFTKLIHKLFEK